MSYSSGLYLMYHNTTVECETAAADVLEIIAPFDCTVQEFGLMIMENFVAQSTNLVVKLQSRPTASGTSTTLATITIGDDQTTLKSGDGTKPGQTALTAATDIDVGDVVLASGLPKSVKSGEYLAFEVTQAAGSAGGAFRPYALLKIDGGADTRQTNVWITN